MSHLASVQLRGQHLHVVRDPPGPQSLGFCLSPLPGFSQKTPDPEVGKFNALGDSTQPVAGLGGWDGVGG